MPPVPAAPAAAKPDVVPASWATIPQPEYFREGRFWLPPGIKLQAAYKHWFCVCHPDGSYRDAVAILYVTYDREEHASVVLDCPALGRRWEDRGNWIQDVLSPSMAAMSAHAADLLGLSSEEVRDLSYVTIGWRCEDRPLLRDVSHMGNVRPRVRREPVPA
uniref:Uncharacterized protein n=1 Tax=Desulfovibrio sp. U5L TaxID=596152 RepID=I2Q2Q4_9BACT